MLDRGAHEGRSCRPAKASSQARRTAHPNPVQAAERTGRGPAALPNAIAVLNEAASFTMGTSQYSATAMKLFSQALLDELTAKASASPRLRANHNIHTSPS